MSEINHKFEYVEGMFDTETGQIVCVGKRKYGDVELCFKCNFHIPFAKIRLFSRDRAVDADAVFDDALVLGKEIENRWNNYERLKRENEELHALVKFLHLETDGEGVTTFDLSHDFVERLRNYLPEEK